jgi:hypothetical protein
MKLLKKIFCDFLGWHTVKSLINADSDGFNLIARCDRCKCRVLMDSQGNWFKSRIQ